jgi:DNA-binding CsgD family transcriptional regulator
MLKNEERDALLRKYNSTETSFFKTFAKNYLAYLGNDSPTHRQLAEIAALLSSAWIKQPICFDIRLSQQEKQCLYLSAQGKGLKEIAAFLSVSVRRVTQQRQSIFKKLNCRNIPAAVIIGIRYGEMSDEHLSREEE